MAQMLLMVFKLYSSHEKNLKQATKQHLAGLLIEPVVMNFTC